MLIAQTNAGYDFEANRVVHLDAGKSSYSGSGTLE